MPCSLGSPLGSGVVCAAVLLPASVLLNSVLCAFATRLMSSLRWLVSVFQPPLILCQSRRGLLLKTLGKLGAKRKKCSLVLPWPPPLRRCRIRSRILRPQNKPIEGQHHCLGLRKWKGTRNCSSSWFVLVLDSGSKSPATSATMRSFQLYKSQLENTGLTATLVEICDNLSDRTLQIGGFRSCSSWCHCY